MLLLACMGMLLVLGALPTTVIGSHAGAECELERTPGDVVEDDTPETLEPRAQTDHARDADRAASGTRQTRERPNAFQEPELPPPRSVG